MSHATRDVVAGTKIIEEDGVTVDARLGIETMVHVGRETHVIRAYEVHMPVAKEVKHSGTHIEKAVALHPIVHLGADTVVHSIPIHILDIEHRVLLVNLSPKIVESVYRRSRKVGRHESFLARGKQDHAEYQGCQQNQTRTAVVRLCPKTIVKLFSAGGTGVKM